VRVAKQAFNYAIVGFCQLALEWLSFFAMTALGLDVVPANVLSRVAGAMLGYWLNGRYTFANQGAVLSRHSVVRFSISWTSLTVLGTWLLHEVDEAYGLQAAWVGKPVIDVLLAGLGFLASKFWVYERAATRED